MNFENFCSFQWSQFLRYVVFQRDRSLCTLGISNSIKKEHFPFSVRKHIHTQLTFILGKLHRFTFLFWRLTPILTITTTFLNLTPVLILNTDPKTSCLLLGDMTFVPSCTSSSNNCSHTDTHIFIHAIRSQTVEVCQWAIWWHLSVTFRVWNSNVGFLSLQLIV